MSLPRATLLISRLAHAGGLENYATHLARAFVKKGCPTTILTTEPASIDGVSVVKVAERSRFSLSHQRMFDLRCQLWLRTHPQEIVFGLERTTYQTHYRAGSGVHAVYLQRRTLVDTKLKTLTHACNPLHRTLLKMEKKAFEAPTLQTLFTNSHMVKEEILEHYALPEEKLCVIHNGVDWKGRSEVFEKSLLEKRSRYELLFVGNGYRRKGLGLLLEALSTLACPDVHLSVVGKDRELGAFEQLASRLKVSATFYGPQKNLTPFYAQADALALPTLYDPFANVTLEALAMGLFVVTSKYNGAKEVLGPESGIIIDRLGSCESLAEALSLALKRPKSPSSARATRLSIEELDFSRQLDKIVSRCIS